MKFKKFTMSLSLWISIAIAILGGLSAIVQQRDKERAGKKASERIDSLQSDLNDANRKLEEKTDELKKYVTGDNTIPKIYALILSEERKIKFHFFNKSKYPIPDIHVLVNDMTKIIEIKKGKIH